MPAHGTGPLAAILGLLWCLFLTHEVLGDEFDVTRVATRVVDGKVLLDAQVDVDFSAAALEALDNGVPLTLGVHIQVRRKGAWVWEESLADKRIRYRISYHPLSDLYEVVRQPDGGSAGFVTRDAAIAALSEIDGAYLLPRARLQPNIGYQVWIKVSLDIEALPLPLRPLAYLKPSWHLSSGWSQWPLIL